MLLMLCVLGEKILDVARVLGYLPAPQTESAMRVHGSHPFVKEAALHLVLFGILSLHLEDEVFPGRKADEKIRTVLPDHATVDIENLEREVVVLDPGGDVRVVVKLVGLG